MKYLKEFATQQEYEAYIANTNDLPNVSLIDEDDSVKYKQKPDYSKQYLTFVAVEDGTFNFKNIYNNPQTIDYSLDGGETWTTLANNANTPTIHQGDKIMWKNASSISSAGFGRFASTGKYNVEGNVMSIPYGDNFIGQETIPISMQNTFMYLFSGCTGVTSAENLSLPATTLVSNCYNAMFKDCTSLTTAPQLPATTLTGGCYRDMFRGCTSLLASPELPATTLSKNCYRDMFYGCTSLDTAPELPATTLADGCYQNMFLNCRNVSYIKMLATDISASLCLNNWVNGVAATGTFVKATSQTSLPSGDNGIPRGWTVINE